MYSLRRLSESSFTAYKIDRGSMLKSTRWEKTPQQHWLANLVLANICDRSSFISISWCNKLFIFLFLSTFQINISLKSKHHISRNLAYIHREKSKHVTINKSLYSDYATMLEQGFIQLCIAQCKCVFWRATLPRVRKIFGTRTPMMHKEFLQVVWNHWAENSRRINTSDLTSLKLWIRLVFENLRWHSQMTT